MAMENERKVICPNCGGEFKEQSAKCPYCGTMYYPGAEEEYLKKLEHVRTDLEDLGAVPEQETVKAIKKRAGWVIKLAVAAIIVIVLGAGFLAWKNPMMRRHNTFGDRKIIRRWKKCLRMNSMQSCMPSSNRKLPMGFICQTGNTGHL